ncbi:hypothetical protein J3459_018651 [Metarhizium acridum]|nr:hypothetical protein J3459_018651 [Metarhizium acridum]
MAQSVQCYYLPPNSDVPNSPLPVLHYRGVLPSDATEDMVTKFLTANTWEKRGAWGHIGIRHFHPNTHECYGIVSGRSTMLLGKINDGTGVDVEVQRGDVIVLPAGTAHSSIESTPDYFYIGVYPRVSSTVWRTCHDMRILRSLIASSVVGKRARPKPSDTLSIHHSSRRDA